MKTNQYWWLKVLVLLMALAGVVWTQCSLQQNIQNPSQEKLQEPESIPAKVEIGK